MGYSRVQIFATLSAQSFILGSSATSMIELDRVLENGHGRVGFDRQLADGQRMLQVRRRVEFEPP